MFKLGEKQKNRKKRVRPLNSSISAACFLSALLLGAALAAATYRMYTTALYERYQKQMKSIVSYIESQIDHDDMSRCAETYVETEKYRETHALFDSFVDYYDDLHYLYILKPMEPGSPIRIRSICSANSTYEKLYEPENVLNLGDGDESWYTEEVAQQFREIMAGDEDVFFEEASEWSVDYTLARPLINSKGEHYAVLCVDVSIDEIHDTIHESIYANLVLMLMFGGLFVALLLGWMQLRVSKPLKALENSVVEFAASSHGKRDPEALIFHPPDIQMNSEIEALSDAVVKMSVEMRDYVKRIAAAENKVEGLEAHMTEMNDMAYRDALTQVSNKAAYDQKVEALNGDVAGGRAEFAIVMMDLNSLKVINDEYGHSRGNDYIVGSCKLLCDVYQHSPVYRVGGDEFVVILQGRDYRDRDRLFDAIRRQFRQIAAQKELDPWDRYSAAVGMAVYRPGRDPDADTVFKRADGEMYEAKAAMKAAMTPPERHIGPPEP